jgi:hypothetical protein
MEGVGWSGGEGARPLSSHAASKQGLSLPALIYGSDTVLVRNYLVMSPRRGSTPRRTRLTERQSQCDSDSDLCLTCWLRLTMETPRRAIIYGLKSDLSKTLHELLSSGI